MSKAKKAWRKGGGSAVSGASALPIAVSAVEILQAFFPELAEMEDLRNGLTVVLSFGIGWIIGAVKEWTTDKAEERQAAKIARMRSG